MKWLSIIALCACVLCSGSAHADDVGESIRVSMDGSLSNQYYFRGLRQGAKGVVMQGSATLRVALADREDFKFQTVTGAFLSLHPGDERNGEGFSAALLELRAWGGLGVWTPYLRVEGLFTTYTSPNKSFKDVMELDLVVELLDDIIWTRGDEDELFRGFAPRLTVAQEVSGARDGRGVGTYLELSTATRLRLVQGALLDIEFVFPVSLGMSLNDYYQIPGRTSGKIESYFLGYAAVGVFGDFNYRWVPDRLGNWRGRLGCDVIFPKAEHDASVLHVDPVETVVRGELVFGF